MEIEQVVELIAALPDNWHECGIMPGDVIREIHETICDLGLRLNGTAETGCGCTTLLFSHLSKRHLVFTVGSNNSLSKVRTSDLFNQDSVVFCLGPSQITLPGYPFDQELSLALIDGAHGYPFPEMDYYWFYPHFSRGGLLIVDDIHIPTITNLYEFLREDAMWELVKIYKSTAFFRRTGAPVFDPLGDGWWLQEYNKKRRIDSALWEAVVSEGWLETGDDSAHESAARLAGREHRPATLQQRIQTRQKEFACLTDRLTSLEAALLERDQLIAALYASTSWRVTAPIRAVRQALTAAFRLK